MTCQNGAAMSELRHGLGIIIFVGYAVGWRVDSWIEGLNSWIEGIVGWRANSWIKGGASSWKEG